MPRSWGDPEGLPRVLPRAILSSIAGLWAKRSWWGMRHAFSLDLLAEARDFGAGPCSFGHPRHRQFVVEIVHDAGPELDERRHDASPERQGVAFSLGVELIVPRFACPVAADDDEAPLPRRSPGSQTTGPNKSVRSIEPSSR